MMYDDYDDQQPGVSFAKALSGLSLLPRSKRSICFQVLEGAVTGTCTDDKHFTTEHQNAHTSQTTTTLQILQLQLHLQLQLQLQIHPQIQLPLHPHPKMSSSHLLILPLLVCSVKQTRDVSCKCFSCYDTF